jgi:glycosyltransferase involved in cell wall biosynthesis
VLARKAGLDFEAVDFVSGSVREVIQTLRAIVVRHRVELIDVHGNRDSRLIGACRDLAAVVRTRHHLESNPSRSLLRRLHWRTSYDRVIAVADCVAEQLVQQGLVRRGRISTVGEWAGAAFFEAPEHDRARALRSDLGLETGCFTIGAFGIVRPAKGFQILIQALSVLLKLGLQARLLLVGGASGRTGLLAGDVLELATLARRLGIAHQILFTGFREDVFDLLHLLDIVIVPSLNEARSRIVPEAFACGLPVIASSTGGLVELIEHGTTGWLTPPGNPHLLAECIGRVAGQPEERARVAANGRVFALRHLRQDSFMEQTLHAYAEALRSASRRIIPPRYVRGSAAKSCPTSCGT